ncbi:MAG: biotin--[acetyl-CoA-carboxylase] ligase [Candidatus Omnitrophica bacterium]|nr:biotin--[acetyl-CoA-carboxylase] ligase [Candidatus Omnitrophota bacterium]
MNPVSATPEKIFTLRDTTIYYYREVQSTMEVAWDLATKGGQGIVWAEKQTGGRGRYGRRWDSPTGGIYLSWIFTGITPGYLSVVAAAAVVRTLKGLGLAGCRVKWPNDIILNQKKISGILVEERGEISVVGIGVNLNSKASTLPPGATSFYEITGAQISSLTFLEKLIQIFEEFVKRTRWQEGDWLNLWSELFENGQSGN